MSQRLKRDYDDKGCYVSAIYIIGIFLCSIIYEVLFNKLIFLDAIKTTMSTLGVFTLVMIVLGILIVFPLTLFQIKRSNKKFLDSLRYKRDK